jgi:tRNA1Val (adenine37-N6)-methyltransferase
MSVFHFRDFSIVQDQSPLKVGTDALLLGATVQIASQSSHILDVGTGTGVIALILASRFEDATIEALEPNLQAFTEAQLNFEASIFKSRLLVHHTRVEAFENQQKFDLIVSNPPYFIDDLKSDNLGLNEAKHLSKDSFNQFLEASLHLLSPEGVLWLILPKEMALKTIEVLALFGFFLQQKIRFHSNSQKLDVRWVLAFSRIEAELQEKSFFIRNDDGTYHQDYIQHVGYLHSKEL